MVNFSDIGSPTGADPTHNPHSPDASGGAGTGTDQSENRERLAHIRHTLLEYRPDILNDELRAAVTSWLLEASDIPAADTEDYITTTLMELQQGNAMFEQVQHTDGSEAFPEVCRGCPHYGVRCPVLTDIDERKRRERIMRSAGSAKELRREMKEYAIDNDCQVLLDIIADLSESVEPLLASGRKLLMAVREDILFADPEEGVDREVQRILESIEADSVVDPDANLSDLDATADLAGDADGDADALALDDSDLDLDLDALRPDGGQPSPTGDFVFVDEVDLHAPEDTADVPGGGAGG